MIFRCIAIILVMFGMPLCAEDRIAYFCVPVADLLLKPVQSRSPQLTYLYDSISISPEKGMNACPRAHQGLFNEQVTVIQEYGDEVQVELSNCFFDDAFYYGRQARFWTRREWIVFPDELEKIPEVIFPAAIDSANRSIPTHGTVTLIMPWFDTVTKKIYAAGTRFVAAYRYTRSEHSYRIYLYDPTQRYLVSSYVPAACALVDYPTAFEEQRALFLAILYRWCMVEDMCVPYVWGGVSFTTQCPQEKFGLIEEERNGELIQAWERPHIQHKPYCGFDCSGLLLRAAQIAGLPYFFKNTTTLFHHMKPLDLHDTLMPGDLIWFPGHVAAIGLLERNEIIEAAGYAGEFGCVHACTLSDRFEGIVTWHDLLDAYYAERPLCIKNKQGIVYYTAQRFTILKLSSLLPHADAVTCNHANGRLPYGA